MVVMATCITRPLEEAANRNSRNETAMLMREPGAPSRRVTESFRIAPLNLEN